MAVLISFFDHFFYSVRTSLVFDDFLELLSIKTFLYDLILNKAYKHNEGTYVEVFQRVIIRFRLR